MMRSMTGFGRGAAEGAGVRVQVEAGSVNRKNLDVHVSIPKGMSSLETVCQKRVGYVCQRGRIQLRVEVESHGAKDLLFDRKKASELLDEVNGFAREQGLSPVDSVQEVLALPGLWKEGVAIQTDEILPELEKALALALGELQQMRVEEGNHLAVVLEKELDQISGLLDEAEPMLVQAKVAIEERYRDAVSKISEIGKEVEQRLLQELALLTEKADVQEEFDRLRGHVQHFKTKMTLEGPIGRALDFLCQEMAREWNTFSVKTPHAGLNQIALQGKERVERLREQVQNVE